MKPSSFAVHRLNLRPEVPDWRLPSLVMERASDFDFRRYLIVARQA
jgi:hypothetical protein